MADETKVPVHEEQDALVDSVIPESTAPGLEADGPPIQEGGDVVVDFEKINQLMAERRAAAREEVERNESDAPGHEEQTGNTDPPLPGVGDGSAPAQEGDPAPSGGDGSKLTVDGIGTKVIDFAATGRPDNREPLEKTQEELDAEQGKKTAMAVLPRTRTAPRLKEPASPARAASPRRIRRPRSRAKKNGTKWSC